MTNFEAPEIKVVMFRTEDIATAGSSAGGGYEDNQPPGNKKAANNLSAALSYQRTCL